MTGHTSVDDGGIVSRDRVCDTVQAILRTAQATGYPDERLSQLSGVPARTIKSYRCEGKQPNLGAALSISAVLGSWAVNQVLALIGYQGSPLDDADKLQPSAIVAGLACDLSVIATAAADGRFDHTEMPGVTDAADHIIATVLPLSRAGRHGG